MVDPDAPKRVKKTRAQVTADVDAFLANGGEIEQIKSGTKPRYTDFSGKARED